jgi:outer membrane protein OmpA-like peptidoglycan-associated protein
MAEDWAVNVKKYAPDADDSVIAAIVRHCGIALQNRDSSLVSFTDPAETGRVRDNFCRKKLGLTDPDPEIDAAIQRVGERMRDDRTRNRVTVYYLLAEAFGKLGLFGAAAAPAAAAPVGFSSPAPSGQSVGAGQPAFATASASSPARTTPVAAWRDEGPGYAGFGLAALAGLGAIVIGTATVGSLIGRSVNRTPAAPAAVSPAVFDSPAPATAAPAAAASAIPNGAGVTAQEVAGKPMVSVYFDTAKTDIAPDFATVAAPVKAWIDTHPGTRVAVSGFNDASGNAAFNAELSKNRAKAVAAALAAMGVPAGMIDLEKPPATTDTNTSMGQARRVDIVVKDAS